MTAQGHVKANGSECGRPGCGGGRELAGRRQPRRLKTNELRSAQDKVLALEAQKSRSGAWDELSASGVYCVRT